MKKWTIFALICAVMSLSAKAVDFGDHSSSTLATKAWEALGAGNFSDVHLLAGKCKELYLAKAKEQQASLTAPAPKDTASSFWALNDVGTCLYISGEAYEKQGNNEKAIESYKTLVNELSFSQCWDQKGWFWSPADAAKKRIQALEFQMSME